MLIKLWRLKRDEDGQAIVIAAVGLLLLAFAVLGTATLGNAIHEKIRLQNAADAAAYSIAAIEARAFNFYAFTNRTMVSHYTAIMTLQSYLAVASFIISAVNAVRVVVTFAQKAKDKWCVKPLFRAAEAAFPVVQIIARLLDIIGDLLTKAANTLYNIMWGTHRKPAFINYSMPYGGLDGIVGWIAIPFFVLANWVLYLAQVSMMAAVTKTVTSVSFDAVDETYANTPRNPPRVKLAGALANLYYWNEAHDPEAMNVTPSGGGGRHALADRLGNPMTSVSPGVLRAERAMTEIANATRYTKFVYNRSVDKKSLLDVLSQMSFGMLNFELHGSTKMITPANPNPDVRDVDTGYDRRDLRGTGRPGFSTSSPAGGSLIADQWLKLRFFFIKYDMTEQHLDVVIKKWNFVPRRRHAVVAAAHKNYNTHNRGKWGWHCVLHLRRGSLCLIKVWKCICKVKGILLPDRGRSSCSGSEPNANRWPEGSHPWWGVVPFMKFHPKPDGSEQVAFNQPSTWAWVHQPQSEIDLDPMMQQDVLRLGTASATHNTSAGTSTSEEGLVTALFEPGFHAISRGMAYYHRPGVWREHPNFFNPYWRPKLAPVQPVLEDLVSKVGINGFFTDQLSKRLITH